MKEDREIRIAKATVNANRTNGYNFLISISKTWANSIGINKENRDIELTLQEDKIIIKKSIDK